MSIERRMGRIFAADGKSLTLALDGPGFTDKTAGVDDAARLVPQMAQVGLDHVLVCYGQARNQSTLFTDVAMSLRCDASANLYDPTVPATVLNFGVEDALRLGADSVLLMNFPGAHNEAISWEYTTQLSRDAAAWGMPVLVETMPFGYPVTTPESIDPHHIAAASRTSVEAGADIVKTRFSGTDADREIVESCPAPVLALGGPKTDTASYFGFVEHVMSVGASGIAVGRNITQDPKPLAMVAALNLIVHEQGTATAAMKLYEQSA